jgi:C-terminal processing protease CtpA/Prc
MLPALARIAVLVPLVSAGCFPSQSPAENRSLVELESVTPEQSANLALLGKVWGFLKHHHPRVAQGELDWDAELFRALPLVLRAPDPTACSAALVAWCREVGEPQPCVTCAEPTPNTQIQAPIAWIRDDVRLGTELSDFLQRVYANRSSEPRQRYVEIETDPRRPLFEGEDPCADASVSDVGFRLLALFRFWNVIEYWFPYRDQIGEDWDAVLQEFVPRLVDAHDKEAYTLAIMALVARIHDTHANLVDALDMWPPRGEAMLPLIVRFVEGRAMVIGPLDGAVTPLFRRGDVILALDGRPVTELIEEWRPFFGASNEGSLLRNIEWVLTRGPKGPLGLSIERDGQQLELATKRVPGDAQEFGVARTHDLPGEAFRLLTAELAYVKLSTFRAAEIPALLTLAQGTRAMIVDIRNYPREPMVFALGEHFVTEPTCFVRFLESSTANPGAFAWTVQRELHPQAPHYAGRVVVLVDESSVSQSEYTTMAFRSAPGALVVGSATAGADGNVTRIRLPCGLSAPFSSLGIFYPDGRPTQRIGIVPDIEVRPTVAGMREGRDEVLEAALQAVLGDGTTREEVQRIAGAALHG